MRKWTVCNRNTINGSIIGSTHGICNSLVTITNINSGGSRFGKRWNTRCLWIRFVNSNTLCGIRVITSTVASGSCKRNGGITKTIIVKLKLFLKIIVGSRLKNLGSSVIYTNRLKATAASITSTNSKSNVSGGSRIV